MFCIVGLGNPGPEYQLTRHNAGFLAVARIAATFNAALDKKGFQSRYTKIRIAGRETLLVQPQTFMNLSGLAVQAVTAYYKVTFSETLVIYDDLDLPLGAIRIRPNGSSGGHKGMTSVINQLGTAAIPRLRIGIGRATTEVVDYVLNPVNPEQQQPYQEAINKAAAAAIAFVTDGITFAMDRHNFTPNSQPQA